MSGEALRAMFYAIGATLIAVGGFDDALVAANIPALGLISAGVAKMLMALGTLSVGYAKTGKILGDVSIRELVGEKLQEHMDPAKRDTQPGVGPAAK